MTSRVVPTGLTAARPAFERTELALDLLRCQRHYEKSFLLNTTPAQNVGIATGEAIFTQFVAAGVATIVGHTRWTVRKRVTPTMIVYNPAAANGEVRNENVPNDCSGTGNEYASEVGFTVYTNCSAGSTIGNKLGFHWTADSSI